MFRPGFHQNNPPKRINDLPPELIILILEAALDEVVKVSYYQGGHYLGTLKTLAAVCRTWKSTIQDTPSFWNVIESTITPNEMHYMLRKSEKCTLTFRHLMERFDYSGRNVRRRTGLDTSDFFDVASFNMSRCSSLSFAVKWYRQAVRVLGSPAPILREAVAIASDRDSVERIILFDGQAGMLENLWLSDIPIRWDLGLPPRLRRIKISYSDAPITWLPTPGQVVSALSTCGGIESFDLSGRSTVHGRLEWEELGVGGPMVELPMLKELKIENMSIAGSAYILQHLLTPPLRNLGLTQCLQRQVDTLTPLLYPPGPPLIESIRSALVCCEKVTLNVERKQCTLEIEGVGGHVYLLLQCADPDELTSWLAEELVSELSSVPELVLEASSSFPGPELRSLPKLMEALRNLVRLHCSQVYAAAGDLAEHLARPYQASDGWRWHWPGLKNLDLNDACHWNELALTMFRDRYGASQEEDGGTSVGTLKWRPSPLTSLRLGGMESMYPETFQEIVDIVGKEVLEEGAFVPEEHGWFG
ncbi:hypothetical protein M407DRAFT_20143 [Tulasnella calospora MUT 4182]|uniref:Uncharacterized protein n=1 Tax=Tulasnella calospora MUT 4182 TaxID=1051891 RepID=A0A0C3QQL2_9AGAM|nr:hypothetical protein M407DRAFT_20143 [Tulasnella calospora MUT 4182]